MQGAEQAGVAQRTLLQRVLARKPELIEVARSARGSPAGKVRLAAPGSTLTRRALDGEPAQLQNSRQGRTALRLRDTAICAIVPHLLHLAHHRSHAPNKCNTFQVLREV